jgi:Domain of unknown function (DUF5063)
LQVLGVEKMASTAKSRHRADQGDISSKSASVAADHRLVAIAGFAAVAQGYCDWCEQQRKGRNPGKAAAQWLSRLNESVLNLPHFSSREKLPPVPRVCELLDIRQDTRIHLNMFNWHYRKVFDLSPGSTEMPVIGWLQDDLTDVYNDLSRGLVLYENGYPLNACALWKSMHVSHWGMHATGAMMVIYLKKGKHVL